MLRVIGNQTVLLLLDLVASLLIVNKLQLIELFVDELIKRGEVQVIFETQKLLQVLILITHCSLHTLLANEVSVGGTVGSQRNGHFEAFFGITQVVIFKALVAVRGSEVVVAPDYARLDEDTISLLEIILLFAQKAGVLIGIVETIWDHSSDRHTKFLFLVIISVIDALHAFARLIDFSAIFHPNLHAVSLDQNVEVDQVAKETNL